jgi:acylphosphatase
MTVLPGPDGGPQHARLSARVDGHVQGVGFRWWVRARASELGLAGSATNMPDGSVEVIAEGPRSACEQLLALLRGPGTPGRVRNVTARWSNPSGRLGGFSEH